MCSSRAAEAAPEAAGLPLIPGPSLWGLFALLQIPCFPPASVLLPLVLLRGSNLPPRGLCGTGTAEHRLSFAGIPHGHVPRESQHAPPCPPLGDEASGDRWGSPEGDKATVYPKFPPEPTLPVPRETQETPRSPLSHQAGAALQPPLPCSLQESPSHCSSHALHSDMPR